MIVEKQQLIRGYMRIIYKCEYCLQRIGRVSTHNGEIIGAKLADSFPGCPYCKGEAARLYGIYTNMGARK